MIARSMASSGKTSYISKGNLNQAVWKMHLHIDSGEEMKKLGGTRLMKRFDIFSYS
jgi:hypothetical protein